MQKKADAVVVRMQQQIDQWEAAADNRAIFLRCYAMMTQNMLIAVQHGEFHDNEWVATLLHRFADYYFDALAAYESQHPDIPIVWKLTFDSCCRPDMHVLQHLLLGVNAHINFDLVFVIYDLLHEEWPHLTPPQLQERYEDHCHVNDIIYRTIDSVQDDVVEQYSPAMDIVDKLFLKFDEWMLHRLISRWREQVWEYAAQLMQSAEDESPAVRQQVAEHAMLRSRCILLEHGVFGLRHLF